MAATARAPESARDRLIVALDVPTVSQALDIVERLDGTVSFYKVGLHLQFDRGLHTLFDKLLNNNKRIFVDFKAFDIPETVEGAVRMASEIGLSFITVVGQRHIIEAAVRARSGSFVVEMRYWVPRPRDTSCAPPQRARGAGVSDDVTIGTGGTAIVGRQSKPDHLPGQAPHWNHWI